MKDWKRYTVTAALPYANGPKHIGHLAGAYLPADIYVRYLRSNKRDVIFICGSDEHGTAIPIQAKKENTSPTAIIDRYHALLKDNFPKLGIELDVYHRTSEPIHHETAQDFFKVMYDKGLFTEEVSEQYFDEETKTFLADRYIVGTCPNCGNPNAYGDQCERCGKTLSPKELINAHSTLSGKAPILKATKHWYLPLQDYEPWLKEWLLEGHKDDWKPNAYGQCKSWIDAGLQPRAMTRDQDWGIKVPLPGAEGKVLYVWFDAPIGYISATKQLFKELESGKYEFANAKIQRPFVHQPKATDWELYWKDKDTRLLHFIGKDNIVFHCIIFPSMLHAHGEFIVPDNVPANEFVNLEGDKMSTSRGWSVEMYEYLEEFPDRPDELRFVLASIMPEAKDSEFTWKDYQTRVNSELVGIFGIFVNRVLVLTEKYFEGKVPQAGECNELKNFITEQHNKISESLENFKFRDALAELMNVARHGNKLLTEKEPWKTFKQNPESTGITLYDSLQIIGNLAILCEPFLPFTSKKLFAMLNLDAKDFSWSDIGRQDLLKPGHQLGKPALLYQKIEDEVIQKQVEKLQATKQVAPSIVEEAKPQTSDTKIEPKSESLPIAIGTKSEITFDDFSKLDLRVGTILTAEKVKKSDKLLKLSVDIGFETRTVVSGIAQFFKPEDIIGQQVSLVANLAPRKMLGIESKGMILMAEDENGKLQFVLPKELTKNGSTIK